MKTNTLLLTAVLGLTSAVALGNNPVWDPSDFSIGNPYLVAGWNFNDVVEAPASQLVVSHGAGSISTNWNVDNIGNFSGTSTNRFGSDGNGSDIAFTNGTVTAGIPANEGNWLQFNLDMTNLESLVMTYAGRTTATGMRDLTWSYSTDGSTFTNFSTVDHVALFGASQYGLVTLNFSSISALNDQSNVIIRGTFATQTGQSTPTSAGSTRFDNVQFNAVVIPEPGTIVMVGILGLAALIGLRRRK